MKLISNPHSWLSYWTNDKAQMLNADPERTLNNMPRTLVARLNIGSR